jgi:prepilin-type N-terminal cleavage/methylation domain-containing protein
MEKMTQKYGVNSPRKAKGFTLLELLLVVAIVAIALAVLFFLFGKVQSKSTAQTEAQNLVTMAADVKGLFSPQGNFTNINDQVLVQNNVPPTGMVSGTNIVNGWGGAVTVAAAGTGDSEATFQYDGVPTGDSCSGFVQGAQSAFSTITVNGQTVKDVTTGAQFSAATLGAACNGANGGTVSVVYTLMK